MAAEPTIRQQRQTYCRICEAACGLIADLDQHGQVVRLRPDREHPLSRGFACAKGTRFLETANDASRVLRPLRRQPDGGYEPTSWDDAYARIAAAVEPILAQHGPHAVGLYFGNPLAFNAAGAAALLAFMKALGTRNVFAAGSQDCNNKFAGAQLVHGSPVIHPIPDFAHADLAVLFGTNPAVSQSSFVHLEGGTTVFDRLKARGGEVVVVDPRRSETAARWGEHVAIRPGTDAFLLLALLDELSDRYQPAPGVEAGLSELLALAADYPVARAAKLSGVPVRQIRALAERLRSAERAALHMSIGVNQGPFGTLAYVALQALSYLTGNFDAQGGQLFHPLAVAAGRLARRDDVHSSPKRSRIGDFPHMLDSLPGGVLAEEIATPGSERIRALICIAGDPLRSIPGEGALRAAFQDLDLLVTIDMFQGATGQLADIVLPATSWLERSDVATTTTTFQTAPAIQYAGPVVAPPGQCRSDARILAELSVAVGRPLLRSARLTRAAARWPDALTARLLDGAVTLLGPLRPDRTRRLLPAPVPKPGRYLGRGPATPERTVRFWHPDLAPEVARLAAHATELGRRRAAGELLLVGRRRRLGHNSWLQGGTRTGDPEAAAWLHPADLKRLDLEPGDTVEIASDAAGLRLPVVPQEGVAPGTVIVPHGLWQHNVNAIIPSGAASGMIEPLSGQHVMTGIAVRVRRVGAARSSA